MLLLTEPSSADELGVHRNGRDLYYKVGEYENGEINWRSLSLELASKF